MSVMRFGSRGNDVGGSLDKDFFREEFEISFP